MDIDWNSVERVVNGIWSSMSDHELQNMNDREFVHEAQEAGLNIEEAEEGWADFSERVLRVFHVYSPLASGR